MKFTRTVSTSFNADTQVLDVPITLTFDASNKDVDILMHINQVAVDCVGKGNREVRVIEGVPGSIKSRSILF